MYLFVIGHVKCLGAELNRKSLRKQAVLKFNLVCILPLVRSLHFTPVCSLRFTLTESQVYT